MTVLVGLTGGIASGKSTVAAMLGELGAIVVDADRLARVVLEPGTPGLAAVVGRFGPEVVDEAGELRRGVLAGLVFDDDAARRDLEAIVHPAVGAAFEDAVASAPAGSVVVHDVPLLVENGLATRYDLVLVTHAPLALRLERAVARGMTPEQARARIAAQVGDDERFAVADVVIETGGSLASTSSAVREVWRTRIEPLLGERS